MGTRQVAKSLMAAAEAAAAPDPAPRRPGGEPVIERPVAAPSTRAATPRAVPPIVDPRAVKAQAGNLKKSVLSPVARFSSVLWLEVTGTFFTMFAVVLCSNAWRLRHFLHSANVASDEQHFYLSLGLGALFGYFAGSSFVRARRRERR